MSGSAAVPPNLVRGAVAGLVAGVVASFAMDRFQAAVSALSPDSGSEDDEPATAKAADAVVTAATGTALADGEKPLGGQVVHYVVGGGLGLAYGIAAEVRPGVTAGLGSAFGIGTAATLDEAGVPAFGLGPAPWRTKAGTHLYTLASHLVFGVVAEMTRRTMQASMLPKD